MDDDDEMQIQPQKSPSPQYGRIAVTVAAASTAGVQAQAKQKSNGGGREDCWSEGATGVLIDAWGERYLELSRGNLKQKHWKEVAEIVSSREDYTKSAKTDIQCKNRIDTVKKKYKLEKSKGSSSSKWPFFHRLDQLIGPVTKNINNNNIPLGIPVKSSIYQKVELKSSKGVKLLRKQRVYHQEDVETEEEDSEELFKDDYSDDCSPPLGEKKKRKRREEVVVEKEKEKEKRWGNSIRMLTQAMLKFGEVYEQAESAKLQQVVEMEKARMKFAKDLELQRMQFFVKTQMEISQLKPCTRGGGKGNGTNNLHPGGNNIVIMTNNNN